MKKVEYSANICYNKGIIAKIKLCQEEFIQEQKSK